jgi:hypothetical protein
LRTKNRQPPCPPEVGELYTRFAANLAALRSTQSMSKGSAKLAHDLLVSIAIRRLRKLGDHDAINGAMGAALLTALTSGISRAEFCAWLRDTADLIDGPDSSR